MCSKDLLVCCHIFFPSMEVKLLNLCRLKQQLPLAWARAWFALHRSWPWRRYRYKEHSCTISETLLVNSWSVQLRKTWQSSCCAGVLMGQQHVWAAGSRQQFFCCTPTGKGPLIFQHLRCLNKNHPVPYTVCHSKFYPLNCSCLMASEFGTCLPARATPSSWLMETASSPCCCTVAGRRSRHQNREKSPTRSPPEKQRVTQSGPPCCPSAWRFAWANQE